MIKVYGKAGDMGQGGYISFGDNASVRSKNVMIGELGEEDCDQLWLQGKHGLYLTHTPTANDTIFFYDDNKGNYAQFNCDVKSSGIFIASDESFKRDINPISDSGEMLAKLKPVQYVLTPLNTNNKSFYAPNDVYTEKDAIDNEFYDNYYKRNSVGELRFGLIAQELEKVFPNLVKTDINGLKYVDYIGLIPVLINAINDLNEEIQYLNSSENQRKLIQATAGIDEVSLIT